MNGSFTFVSSEQYIRCQRLVINNDSSVIVTIILPTVVSRLDSGHAGQPLVTHWSLTGHCGLSTAKLIEDLEIHQVSVSTVW